ncbi:BatD family protein [uncultured Muribaculum sp.]|uniref:BatD family protein n=1 Tax=uncultured Muribaculum sp. TaxID=1918613 RepID=UPI0025FB59E2|nr:BatD family protein [uncultured Muribaculum sp.]
MTRRILTTVLLMMLAVAAAMAETSFTVIPPRTVIAGNKFNVTFRLKDGEGSGLKAPEIKGCTLLYGPSTSRMQNYQWVNGQASSSTTVDYSFTYRADTPGNYTIGEARINSGGKTYSTRPATFTVLPPDKAQQGTQPSARVDDIGTQSADRAVNANDVLVRIILNKTRAYEQEAIVCTIKLYTKHSISSFIPTTQPSFDGFLIDEIPLNPTLNEVEHYNGQNYMTAILKQCIIFPQKSGKLTINSGKYDVTVVQYERMGGFWGGNRPVERQIKTTSNSASVIVDALPQPQPEGFTGAVGRFDISSRLNGQVFKTNEAASLVYTINGTGNIKYIKEPSIDFPTEFEQYQPQVDIDSHVSGSNVTGTMTIDYTFVPQSVGAFKIGADKFVYFDPSTRQYVTLTTPSYDIKVLQGTAASSAVVGKQSVSSKNSDILHIKLGDLDLQKTHTYVYNAWWYWPIYILLLAILVVVVWLYSKQARLNADVQGRRLARAGKVARRRLKSAANAMHAHDSDRFYAELLGAIWGYLGDKLALPASQLTRDNIVGQLDAYGAPSQLVDTFSRLIDDCEMARYSPARSDEQIEQLYREASDAMNEMEGIRKK